MDTQRRHDIAGDDGLQPDAPAAKENGHRSNGQGSNGHRSNGHRSDGHRWLEAIAPTLLVGNGNGAVAAVAVTASRPPACDRFGARVVKRVLDVVAAVLLLVALAPLMLVVALLVRLDSPGPVFFRQRRRGKDLRPFTVVKFRTMRTGVSDEPHKRYIAQLAAGEAGGNGAGLKKLTNDPRVTRVGSVLRRLSIDELPQLFNVVAGHMSLVGPRPALDYELQHYEPRHFERFAVRPGLTGLWQVSGRAELGFQAMLELDAEYARSVGFVTDVRILVRTPQAAIGHTA